MKKEWLLLLASVGVPLVLALGLIRWFAPGLLGIPVDLQLVRVSEKLPPFFEGVFRANDYKTEEFILKDPYTRVRAKPLYPEVGGMGPHDILGFRNRKVPNVADIVVIGDSQTYGNNASLEQNWPTQMADKLGLDHDQVYAMAVGGWGAAQYLDMFYNAVAFQPHLVVVAMYTGNDPLDSVYMAYGHERWRALRPKPDLTLADAPKTAFPAPESEWWPVAFEDGVRTTFTPELRYSSNQNNPVAKAGYGVMAKVAEVISTIGEDHGIEIVFTIIPTKELVYWPKVRDAQLKAPPDYTKLINAEQRNIAEFEQAIHALDNARYVDVVKPLQEAALGPSPLYPDDTNGHPVATGYAVLGEAMAVAVAPLLPKPVQGLVAMNVGEGHYQVYRVKGRKAWLFPTIELVKDNGWNTQQTPLVSPRDLAGLERGVIDAVDVERFGPE